jgi:hypothetical protein
VNTACSTQIKQCYGPDFQSGTFAGDCGNYITCYQKCACTDTACQQACTTGADTKPTAACGTCLSDYGKCTAKAACTVPKCMLPNGGDCATLNTCCGKITDATKKSICTATYNAIKDSGDIACDAAYGSQKANCP